MNDPPAPPTHSPFPVLVGNSIMGLIFLLISLTNGFTIITSSIPDYLIVSCWGIRGGVGGGVVWGAGKKVLAPCRREEARQHLSFALAFCL